MDKPQPPADSSPNPTPGPAVGAPAGQPRRGPGHRGTDMRDTVAEMAERAQLISQEAGSKVAAAMKDVISAAAGIAGFAIESARDLVQYMVKRGQMTPEEADKLIREAEAAHEKRPPSEKGRPTATKIAAEKAAIAKAEAAARAAAAAAAMPPFRPPLRPNIPPPAVAAPSHAPTPHKPEPKSTAPAAPAAKKAKPAAKQKPAAKPSAKSAAKPSAKSAAKSSKTTKSPKPAKKKGGKR
jgi:polyhydroxyalkanoate synthesis regulator phasin